MKIPGHSNLSGKGDSGPFQYQSSKFGIRKGGGHILQWTPQHEKVYPHREDSSEITIPTTEYVPLKLTANSIKAQPTPHDMLNLATDEKSPWEQ